MALTRNTTSAAQEVRRVIRNFSVLYVGNIDLEDVGADGTPADRRRYGRDRLAGALETATEAAELMDELGFYALWMAETPLPA